jgi:hypothetical protein
VGELGSDLEAVVKWAEVGVTMEGSALGLPSRLGRCPQYRWGCGQWGGRDGDDDSDAGAVPVPMAGQAGGDAGRGIDSLCSGPQQHHGRAQAATPKTSNCKAASKSGAASCWVGCEMTG